MGEHQPLRHAVGGRQRHTKFALPRNHSSGRNLAKMGKQAQLAPEEGRREVRQRSHDGDTEIRLPGSLEESSPRPAMRRNMTAYQLPRNTSHTKLKKNLSHGQLTRLHGGGRSSHNLHGVSSAAHKAPPSPGLKGKSRRPKSAEIVLTEKDLHQQEVELHQQQEERRSSGPKKVGFAVGSSGDTSEGDETQQMEGSGLQEDDWTDQSASASPYSTRQNTANNSRTSVVLDKPPDKRRSRSEQPKVSLFTSETQQPKKADEAVQQERPEAEPAPGRTADAELSPRSTAPVKTEDQASQPSELAAQPIRPPPQIRSPLHAAKDHPNPTTRRLVSHQLPAPAVMSNVSALDDGHSNRGSPAASMRSSRSNLGEGANEQDPDELVSRFIPSASHPSTESGTNTGAMNTPKQGSFQTPEQESMLERARPGLGPTSPGSTVSGSSGHVTPALGRSRIELRMMHDKALADREAAAERQPLVPHHIYDRRNETLKSYLNLASLPADSKSGISQSTGLSLGPEIFQGRFKAVNTELKVVQKFRDPIGEAVSRLRECKGTRLSQRGNPAKQQAGALKMSKSAVSLPSRPARESSKLSTSASPPSKADLAKSASPPKTAMSAGKSAVQFKGGDDARRHPRRGVSFAGSPPQTREIERGEEEVSGADAAARGLWESVGL